MSPWPDFLYKGKTYSLSHLNGFAHVYIQVAQPGKPERRYSVQIFFSDHCFTQDLKPSDDPALLYPSALKPRCFHFQRYELSKYLPETIKNLMSERLTQTGHENFLVVKLMDLEGNTVEYEIFFKLSLENKKLKLNVESAYVRDDKERRPDRGHVYFATLIFKISKGEKVRPTK